MKHYKYCTKCHKKLWKSGKTSAGKVRWQCSNCGRRTVFKREDLTRKSQFKIFLQWILSKRTKTEVWDIPQRTLGRKLDWCWQLSPNFIIPNDEIDFVLIDATYLKNGPCCIVTRTPFKVITRHWAADENFDDYCSILNKIPRPIAIVCDGDKSCLKAIFCVYGDISVQRCLVHIQRYCMMYITKNPRSSAGQELKKLVNRLFDIFEWSDASQWIYDFECWQKKYKKFLNTKKNVLTTNGKYQNTYVHAKLRRARYHLREALKKGQLFTFLELGCPNTTNFVEGGINSRLKELRSCHRGLHVSKVKKIFDWYLWKRSFGFDIKTVDLSPRNGH
jgi:hypothetical protein